MSHYIPLFYVDVISYLCHNPNAGVTNLCWERDLRGHWVNKVSIGSGYDFVINTLPSLILIMFIGAIWHPQWPLLLTWFNFNLSMDK